jgi:hypothetical protein
MTVTMEKGQGPVLHNPLCTPADLERLRTDVDVDKHLGYLFEAITLTRKGLKGRVPLIGFCGAPWTLMAYMCEGGGSKTFEKSKKWLYLYPEESKKLLMRIADVCADLLVGQVLAGAQVCPITARFLDRTRTRLLGSKEYRRHSGQEPHETLGQEDLHDDDRDTILISRCSKSSTRGPASYPHTISSNSPSHPSSTSRPKFALPSKPPVTLACP